MDTKNIKFFKNHGPVYRVAAQLKKHKQYRLLSCCALKKKSVGSEFTASNSEFCIVFMFGLVHVAEEIMQVCPKFVLHVGRKLRIIVARQSSFRVAIANNFMPSSRRQRFNIL